MMFNSDNDDDDAADNDYQYKRRLPQHADI